MFTMSVETRFWASHQLSLPDGSKEPVHRHNWSVTAEVSSERLNNMGLVMDFRRLTEILNNIVAEFNNTPLEKNDYFQQVGSSAEIIAKYIYEKLEPKLPKAIILDHIRVVEEPGCSVKFARNSKQKRNVFRKSDK